MALDPTARESNVRDSVKKYFVDNLSRTEGIELTFDSGLSTPKIQGQNFDIDRWVAIQFGSLLTDTMSEISLDIVCCARQDGEGFKLAQLRDKVLGYLLDGTRDDGQTRITLYRSYADRAWEYLGALLVFVDGESDPMTAPDGTKFKVIPCRLKWGMKP
jgi:hypothetical protein